MTYYLNFSSLKSPSTAQLKHHQPSTTIHTRQRPPLYIPNLPYRRNRCVFRQTMRSLASSGSGHVHSVPLCPPFTHSSSLSTSCPVPRPAPPLSIPSRRDATRPAPPLVAEKKKSEWKKTNIRRDNKMNKTHLIFFRQHYSNGKGYENVGKRKYKRNNQKFLPCVWHFPFEIALRLWRYEFETDEKLFFKIREIKFKHQQNCRSRRTKA